MLDVVIRGGEVVDGTGAPKRRADVAIEGDRIVAIGAVDGQGAVEIDATGKVVAPGFVDVHTHYDAQVFWDSALTPSPLHGVTTALAGNCGFTIAPLSANPDDGDYLMRMLARVEGMPLESLRNGVPWGNWTSTAEYLDAVERELGINAGFMVGHSAVRRIVMGDESTSREAKPEEVAAMQDLLRAGLDAGAIGFSSSWARTHNDADGHMVPSRYASRDEVVALAGVASEFEGTSLEFLPQVGQFDQWALDLMADMSTAAQRPLNWNLLAVGAGNRAEVEAKLAASDVARDRGGKVVALTIPMTFPIRLSFASGFVLDAMPDWEHAMLLPRDEKMKLFADKNARDKLNELAQAPNNPMRVLANWSTKVIFDVVAPENEQYRGRTVGEIATEQGRDSWDVLCDIALADELRTSFGTLPRPASDEDWQARVNVWRDGRAVIGASDAGAHLDLLASFHYATEVLEQTVRRRSLLSIEEAVQLLTDVPAQLYGLVKRGRVSEGWFADVIVIDPTTIASHDIAMRFDLPGGAGRLYGEADGIEHVLVNGTPIVRNGKLTNERSGRLIRSGRDTTTPSLA